jgi:glutaredoxin
MYDKALVYSKENCPYCVAAINLLLTKNIIVHKKILGIDTTKEQLLEKIPNAKTVPQIFLYKNSEEVYIGGYDKLKELFDATTGTTS